MRWLILVLHLVLLGVLFVHQGILDDKEAAKYIGCAEAVLQGDLSDLTGNYLKYAAYVLFLLPFVAVGLPQLAILAQVLLGIFAALALGRLTVRISGSRMLGGLSSTLLLLCPLIQSWTLALYTEHFFLCMSVLFLERLERGPRNYSMTVVLGAFILLIRPVGVMFVVPALLWKWTVPRPAMARVSMRVAAVAFLLGAVIAVPRIAAPQLEPIAAGQVIAGVGGIDASGFDGATILDAQRYLLQQVGVREWAGITWKRAVSLFTLSRPNFSVAHNVVNGSFYLLYPLALIGLWRSRNDERLGSLFAILLVNTILIGLTHDEWSGRFLVPLIPLVIVPACCAFVRR